ncbi:MAG: hypothetical protein JWR75_1679 [Devosia sp.]|nr:hypothetical protein [Devosia sp.]
MIKSEDILELVSETATVETHDRVTGRVRVSTVTDTVDEYATADLDRETIEVTRVPMNLEITAVPAIRTEGDVTVVPVVEEVLVVEKRLVLKEELHIRRTTTTENVTLPISLRKQRAVIERTEAEPNPTKEDLS